VLSAMLDNLPQNILWDIFKKLDDVKSCINIWSCCPNLFYNYTPQQFWMYLNHLYFGVKNIEQSSNFNWKSVYWMNHAQQYGCSFCGKCKNELKQKNHLFINISTLKVFVCNKCHANMGIRIVHKTEMNPWQQKMVERRSNYHNECLFKNYFGENHLSWCNKYNMKCVNCLKNIRNDRCIHFCCGKCCHCKYHKSHYESILNYNSTTLLILDVDLLNITKLIRSACNKNKLLILQGL
jgi:hypothetical protein